MRRLSLAVAAMLASLSPVFGPILAAPAAAAPANPLELAGYVMREKVTIAPDGTRVSEWAAPDVVVPGDRLMLGTRFANRGDAPIERVVVSNPVPESLVVAADADPALLVSVDGGKLWGRLADLAVTDPATGQTRPAHAGDITNVRWILSALAPGAAGQLEFPVTVR